MPLDKMKTSQKGYKAMIRDKVPRTVDLALKWCKAKTRWVEYVYYTYVHFLKEKEAKNYQIRHLLSPTFEFKNTIEWGDLTKEERDYWKAVNDWVEWFEKSLLQIIDTYKTNIARGETSEYTKTVIKTLYFGELSEKQRERLYKHIINHIIEYYV